MKRITGILLSLLMVVCLVAGTAVPAFAESFSYTIYGEEGKQIDVVIYEPENKEVALSIAGFNNKPSWVIVGDGNADLIEIIGTPVSAGNFDFQIYFEDSKGQHTMNVTIIVEAKPGNKTLAEITENLTVGKEFTKDYDQLTTGGEIFETDVIGTVPKGMEFQAYDSYFTLTGTPTEKGTYNVTLKALDDHSNTYVSLPLKIVVSSADIKVTKSPTSETVVEGEDAMFISAAENYDTVEWRVVTKDGNNCWRNKNEITSKFTGVEYEAYKGKDGREYLVLSKIPLSMDGYYIQTKFFGPDGKTDFTEEKSCLLTVKEATLEKPQFSQQPQGGDLKIGSEVSLQATATAKDGRVMYQWFKNSTNSTSGAVRIDGATSERYTPPQEEGTVYYFCTAWAEKQEKVSETVYSSITAVTYTAEAKPEETPAPPAPETTPDPAPASDSETGTKEEKIDLSDKDKDKDNGGKTETDSTKKKGVSGKLIIIIIIIILAVALAAALAAYFINRKAVAAAAAPVKFWTCTVCGAHNQGRFCTDCGAKKPAGALQYKCDKCGWEPVDPSDPPKFCPRCGDPFGDEDIVE